MQKVLVIVGPTAVGKSEFAISLAKQYNGEIISGDAYQCYKELNIGSAKVTQEETQGIPHHLINVVSYKEEYNVKIFQQKARACIEDIASRGKLPIICGGTGLYIKSLLYDYVFLDEEIDKGYRKELSLLSNDELFKKLQEVDLKASEILHPNNRKRIERALMMAHSGKTKSEMIDEQEHVLLYNACLIGLTMDREHLYTRINERVLRLIDLGLENEVLNLVESPSDFELQSLQGIGYKEFLSYYLKEATLDDVIAKIQKNTRNFSKRQYTWFNNQMDVTFFDVEDKEFPNNAYEKIEMWVKE